MSRIIKKNVDEFHYNVCKSDFLYIEGPSWSWSWSYGS